MFDGMRREERHWPKADRFRTGWQHLRPEASAFVKRHGWQWTMKEALGRGAWRSLEM